MKKFKHKVVAGVGLVSFPVLGSSAFAAVLDVGDSFPEVSTAGLLTWLVGIGGGLILLRATKFGVREAMSFFGR